MTPSLSQAAFSRHIGKDKGYVTRLKQAGRLVMLDNGMVDVALSLQRIAETADPTRQEAVQKRLQRAGNTQTPETRSESFNDAKTRKEIAQAAMAEIELATLRKHLLDAGEVRLFAADLGTTFRAALEVLPDRLAHELVPLSDADEIRALLVDNFEQLLGDLWLKIGKMGG